jgi:hypothetical protein
VIKPALPVSKGTGLASSSCCDWAAAGEAKKATSNIKSAMACVQKGLEVLSRGNSLPSEWQFFDVDSEFPMMACITGATRMARPQVKLGLWPVYCQFKYLGAVPRWIFPVWLPAFQDRGISGNKTQFDSFSSRFSPRIVSLMPLFP